MRIILAVFVLFSCISIAFSDVSPKKTKTDKISLSGNKNLLNTRKALPNNPICREFENSLTFYSPFDNDITPLFSKGENNSKPVLNGDLLFDTGIKGSALIIGKGAGTVFYPRKDNLDLQKGTVSIWIQPADWES